MSIRPMLQPPLTAALLALYLLLTMLPMANAQRAKARAAAPKKAAEEEEKKRLVVARLTLRGALPEMSSSDGLLATGNSSLLGLVDRMDQAASDEDLSGLILKIRGTAIGRAQSEDLRQAIQRTRAAGRKVYADLESAMAPDYLLACACDHIIMPESGTLMIPGVRAEITFYKTLF
ncbi:MAG: hypothetical protein GY917_09925, partial [Planctomycetaceae bacterium]|nr:hypothetical protein [Planctomycetaceae bacterium]